MRQSAPSERDSERMRPSPPERFGPPLAVPSGRRGAFPLQERPGSEGALRPSLIPVPTPLAPTGPTRHRTEEQTHELKLSFGQLALLHKSLQAVKTLGALPPQDEVLNDTIQLVDLALKKAV
jgi:hypothetical protein